MTMKPSYYVLILAAGLCLTTIIVIVSLYFHRIPVKNDKIDISPPQRLGKLIIDTDAGGDDAGAILLALAAEKQLKSDGLEIIAITCTYGNTAVSNVGKNVLKVLTIANRSDIPVYVGAHRPLVNNATLDNHYGADGFGDFHFDEKILGQIDRTKHASQALADLVRDHAGNVSILALAPLTNIAIATRLDSTFMKNVAKFYIMGSSVRGVGNISPNSEFNFYQDPLSNFIVLENIRQRPAIIFPWETTLLANISVDWRKNILGSVKSRTMKYLNKIDRMPRFPVGSIWKIADIILTGLILWPELIKRKTLTNLTPVFDGSAQGSVLVDYSNRMKKYRNVEILEDFDVEAFKNLLIQVFSRL